MAFVLHLFMADFKGVGSIAKSAKKAKDAKRLSRQKLFFHKSGRGCFFCRFFKPNIINNTGSMVRSIKTAVARQMLISSPI